MDMKRDYYEDIQLLDSNTKKTWFFMLLAVLAILPFVLPGTWASFINLVAIHVIVAIGLNILVGYTGQVSLGHAGFFAIGAYTTALIIKGTGATEVFLLAIPVLIAAGLVAAVFGFILGLPSLKLEGPYLAIATLGFGMAIVQIIGRFSVFGGRNGISLPDITILANVLVATEYFTINTARDIDLYLVVITTAVFLTILARNIIKTRVGRAFVAIRDDDIAAECMGVNLTYYKTLSFAVSAFYTGVAGGLYAFWIGRLNPDNFSFILSVVFLAMVVVGGVGSITGSVLGAIVVTYLHHNLEGAAIAAIPVLGPALVSFSEYWMHPNGLASISYVIFGLIIILIVIFEPLGLYGFWIRMKKYWKTWPF
ncbi:MAG: branched-chain amino acid ABC transporter permease [bacterium]|nr:branched-chain amino acid ABC transporter permease [bacterium]